MTDRIPHATDRIPHANARTGLCHLGESRAGSGTGNRTIESRLSRVAHNAGETSGRQASRRQISHPANPLSVRHARA